MVYKKWGGQEACEIKKRNVEGGEDCGEGQRIARAAACTQPSSALLSLAMRAAVSFLSSAASSLLREGEGAEKAAPAA